MHEDKLWKLSNVYMVINIVLVVLAAIGGGGLIVAMGSIHPSYTYYGNDDVGGWATIFSAVGAGFKGLAMVIVAIAAVCVILAAVYFGVGLVLNHFVRKHLYGRQNTAKGCGTALGILNCLPGVGAGLAFLDVLFSGLQVNAVSIWGYILPLVYTAVFGVYWLYLVLDKPERQTWYF